MDRCYKINNTWIGFDNDLENLTKILNKNQFSTEFKNLTKGHLKTTLKRDTRFFIHFQIVTIQIVSNIAQKKIQNLVNTFCKGIDVKVVIVPFKISNKFSYKDPLPFHLQSFIAYKSISENSKVCYVGETTRHFITRINEHLQKDTKSNIFKHLQESCACNSLCNKDCFQ